MSIASIIVTVIGRVTSSALIATLSMVFGVAVSVNALIPAGSMQRFRCEGLTTRYTYVQGVSVPCNTAVMFQSYDGFYDLSGEHEPQIETEELTISYTPGGTDDSYFTDYSWQARDAATVDSEWNEKTKLEKADF